MSSKTQNSATDIENALTFLNVAKAELQDQPEIYDKFIKLMKTFHQNQISAEEVTQSVRDLFTGYPSLIEGFGQFLPN
ncbi:Paired amphipathic helix protein pst1 [Psilocybe cubensis]|uniref:Paired amphipathic helix protein pst1 n=2 Tax=Psilocybe cubensis TaxID=181762 RepID=A0ACB8GRE3_PSICU|nr:Paired amphipathic helix protein pst1 [Psilocybe cubensis]KAH9477604.1 Paired amphipathic helix protein pst1 [Psilocybe cubensis]